MNEPQMDMQNLERLATGYRLSESGREVVNKAIAMFETGHSIEDICTEVDLTRNELIAAMTVARVGLGEMDCG